MCIIASIAIWRLALNLVSGVRASACANVEDEFISTVSLSSASLCQASPCPVIKFELILRVAKQNPHLYERDVEAILGRISDALVAGD